MWRIGELSRITGINYETVKYYCRPPKLNQNGRNIGGAGLLIADETKGGTNYYDEDSFLELVIIGLMSKCGTSIDDIASALDGDVTYEEVVDEQIKKLYRQIHDIQRSIRTAKLFKRFITSRSHEEKGKILDECMFAQVLDLMADLARDRELNSKLSVTVLDESEATRAKLEDLAATVKELVKLNGQSGKECEARELLKTINSSYSELGIQLEEIGRSLSDSIDKLVDLHDEGISPTSNEAICCIEPLRQVFCCSVPGVCELRLSTEAFHAVAERYITGNLWSVLLELTFGQGTIDYFLRALDAYCRHAEMQVKN